MRALDTLQQQPGVAGGGGGMVGAFRRLNDLQNATPFSSSSGGGGGVGSNSSSSPSSSSSLGVSGQQGAGSAFSGLGSRLGSGSNANAVLALRAVNIVSPNGLQPEQQQRILTMMQASPAQGSPVASKIRTVELFQFWAGMESTANAVDDVISGLMLTAGLKGFSPKAPTKSKTTAAAAPSSSPPSEPQPAPAFNIRVQDMSGISSDDAPAEAEPSAALTVAGMEEMPFSGASSSSSSSCAGGGGVNDDSPKRRHHNRTTFVQPKSPRHVPAAGSHNFLSHIVDEVDAAHARGALSPRSISPNLQLNQDLPCVPQSPLDVGLPASMMMGQSAAAAASGGDRGEASGRRNSPSDSGHSTPRRPPDMADTMFGRPSRSPSPSQRSLSDSDRISGFPVPKPTTASSTMNQQEPPAPAVVKPKYATYQEIPRFHFAEGRPQTQSTTLVGPHSSKHDNPHLTIFDGVALPLGGLAPGPGGSPAVPQGPKIAPMLPLAVMEDEDVLPFITKEFARLPAPPPRAAPASATGGNAAPVRIAPTKGGSSVLRRPTTSSGNQHTKQEQVYRQALTATMHRICSQAFGLPRYFTGLVLRKLLADAELAANSQGDDASTSGSSGVSGASSLNALTRPGTASSGQSGPSSSPSSSTNGSNTTLLGIHITVHQVKEFYEKYLRFKGIVRRMFEVLIATSRANPTAAAAAAISLGGNGNAGTNFAMTVPILGPGGVGGAINAGSGVNLLLASGVLSASTASQASSGVGGLLLGGGSSSSSDGKRNFLVREDFQGYLDIVLESHPGLGFLRQTVDFQSKYVETVVHRIFFDLDRLDRGRISWSEFETSRLPDAFRQVDATDDINTVLNYFSYEHFYVLYCRFWELDEDRDMHLGPQDLQRYGPEGTLNPKIVERIFQGQGRRLVSRVKGKMCYEDFVWFCLSEEDKCHPRSIRYWFKILDLDSDGIISGYELETFYNFTKKQLMQMTSEGIAYQDVVCQVRDMLPTTTTVTTADGTPAVPGLRLGDLLANPHAAFVAMNMIMNVIKFLQFEQRDPFVVHHDRLMGGYERCEWDRFARVEYDRMAQEADEQP